MNRLTEKNGNLYKLKNDKEIYGEENGIRLVQIVGQLEDIEEICEKLINQTFYYKLKNGEIIKTNNIKHKVYYDFKNKKLLCYHDIYISHLLLDEYGKTWAFTREELEK